MSTLTQVDLGDDRRVTYIGHNSATSESELCLELTLSGFSDNEQAAGLLDVVRKFERVTRTEYDSPRQTITVFVDTSRLERSQRHGFVANTIDHLLRAMQRAMA